MHYYIEIHTTGIVININCVNITSLSWFVFLRTVIMLHIFCTVLVLGDGVLIMASYWRLRAHR